jgi:lysophospholipase L1-like esterase
MPLTLALLGDSIAYGQGATSPAHTVGARLAAQLRAAGAEPEVRVFAAPGATSAGLAAQVRRALDAAPDIAVIIIGANDLTRMVPASEAAGRLAAAVQSLRAAGAQVVVAPAPDLSAVPWVPLSLRGAVRAASETLRQAQTRAAGAAGAHVADVNAATAARFAADPTMFSADRFHPSSAGYAAIAAALAPTVLAAVHTIHHDS